MSTPSGQRVGAVIGRGLLVAILCAAPCGELLANAPQVPPNPPNLGDWDRKAGARPAATRRAPPPSSKKPAVSRAKPVVVAPPPVTGPIDGARLVLGAFTGSALFSFNLDLGNHNDFDLTPHGAGAVGARLGLDFDRAYSLQAEMRYASSTYYMGGPVAHFASLRGMLVVHGDMYPWHPFVLIGGGVEILTNDPAPVARDTDPAVHLGLGIRYDMSNRYTLRAEGRALVSDGLERASMSTSFELLVGFSVRFFGG